MVSPLYLSASGSWLGNDGSWSTFVMEVGTPPQAFGFLPALQAQNAWVPVADECVRLQAGSITCGNSRGVAPFQQRYSPGFQANMSSSWEAVGLYELGLEKKHGITGNGLSGFDKFQLSNITLERFSVTTYASPGFWVGQLGLLPIPLNFSETIGAGSLLETLKSDAHIPSLAYGYQAGAPYRDTKVPGSLVLGGYDRSRASDPLTININADISRALTVGLQDIVITNTLNGTLSVISNEQILAPIDSSIAEIWLPHSVCDRFETAFGLEFHEASGRYALADGTRESLLQLNPTFTFTIGTNAVTGGNTTTIQLPYAAFDLQASYPIFANATNYFPIRRAANRSQYAIGRVFLQEAYLGVDFESGIFNVSAARWDNLEPDIVAIPAKELSSAQAAGQGLSGGPIAGIVVGCVAVGSLLVACVWLGVMKRKRGKQGVDENSKVQCDGLYSPDPELTAIEIFEMPSKHGHSEMREARIVPELGSHEFVHELPSHSDR